MHDTLSFMAMNNKTYRYIRDEPFNTNKPYIRYYQDRNPVVLDDDEYPIEDYQIKNRDYQRKWRAKNERR